MLMDCREFTPFFFLSETYSPAHLKLAIFVKKKGKKKAQDLRWLRDASKKGISKENNREHLMITDDDQLIRHAASNQNQ